MRRFWVQSAAAGDGADVGCTRGDFAMRLCASSDLYQARRRAPAKSVNYVVSHDGFTLRDLLSFNQRRNQANMESNRDGHGDNLNFNCGAEGISSEPAVSHLRSQLQRTLLATTLLAQGTPMLCAGDELGHTQGGNNNPYCQDNAATWINWSAMDSDLLAFTQRVIGLRHQMLPFANQWYSGIANSDGVYDLSWLNPDGSALQNEAWQQPTAHALACLIGKPGRANSPLLLLSNASTVPVVFVLPQGLWQAVLDTSHPQGLARGTGATGTHLPVSAHSLMLLQQITRH
jgi:glycogen operon protein